MKVIEDAPLKIPDHMGAWSDDDERIWLPKLHYPTRHDARKFVMTEWELTFTEVRVLSRWMRYTPREYPDLDNTTYIEDWWSLCDPDAPNAFPVWECS